MVFIYVSVMAIALNTTLENLMLAFETQVGHMLHMAIALQRVQRQF